MTCEEAARYLDDSAGKPRSALPSELNEHLERCSGCRKIWEYLCGEAQGAEEAGNQDEIERRILEDLRPVRPIPSRTMRALSFLVAFGLISALFVGVMGAQGVAGMVRLQLAGILAAVVVSAAMVSISLSSGMAPGERRLLPCGKVVLSSLAGLLALVAVLFPWEGGRDLLTNGLGCFRTGFLYSLPAAALIVLLLRRGAPLQLETVGAGAGMLAGLVGLAILHLGCTVHTAPHIMLGHFAIPLLGSAIGYGIGRALPLLAQGR